MFFLAFTVVEKKSHWSNCSLYLWQSGSGWLAGTTLKTERSSSPSVNRFQRSSVASVSLHGIGCRSEVVFWHVVLVNGESNIFHETLSSVACSFHTVTLGHFDLLSWKWARAIFVRNALGGWITVMWHFDKKNDNTCNDYTLSSMTKTSRACPLHFTLSLCPLLSLWPFSTVFHSINFPATLRFFSICSSGLISAVLVVSAIYLFVKVSLSLWYNPLWLTGLKASI